MHLNFLRLWRSQWLRLWFGWIEACCQLLKFPSTPLAVAAVDVDSVVADVSPAETLQAVVFKDYGFPGCDFEVWESLDLLEQRSQLGGYSMMRLADGF